MNIILRVDASNPIGTGHFMRCLTLAEALRGRGAKPRFVSRSHPGHLIGHLRSRAFPVTVLPAPPSPKPRYSEDYASWLGVTQEQDANETIYALGSERPDWLVVDHYGLDRVWEQRLRPYASRLMVIDDIANRRHDCDLLLDQNLSPDAQTRYQSLVPAECRKLLGPHYALLRPEYAAWRKMVRPRNGQVKRVLVFMGGSDPFNLTGLALEVLGEPKFRNLQIDVVIGANNSHRSAIKSQVLQRPEVTLHERRPHLADLMANADLAIGSGGATSWERLCLGLPTLLLTFADNQRPASEALAKAGLAFYAGDVETLSRQQLHKLFNEIIHDSEALSAMSEAGYLQVDGMGVLRVLETLDPTSVENLRLRPAQEDDALLCYEWANEPPSPTQSIHRDPMPWRQYFSSFCQKLDDLQSDLYILEARGLSVGKIQVHQQDLEARIDYSLDPLVHDRGWDRHIVAMGARLQTISEPRFLELGEQSCNIYSQALFLRLDSERDPSICERQRTFSIAILSDQNSWLNAYLPQLILQWLAAGHKVLWTHCIENLRSADFCFYLGCGQIVPPKTLSQYRHNIVVHESDLPRGKGWSPLTWQILEGENRIAVTLFEAAEKVDSGKIYAQEWLQFEGHELIDELRAAQARATLSLCGYFVSNHPEILDQARDPSGHETFYRRRKPQDSQLDPLRTLAEQFQLLRVVDNLQYPAFFEWQGKRYTLFIRKESNTG